MDKFGIPEFLYGYIWDSRAFQAQDRGSDADALFFTIVTGPRRSLSRKLSDTRVYEP